MFGVERERHATNEAVPHRVVNASPVRTEFKIFL